MNPLIEEQSELLVQIVIEECGFELSDDQLIEQIALLLEDVAGFEVMSDDDLAQTIDQIRSAYYVASHP